MTMTMTKEKLGHILRYARLAAEETRTGKAMHAEEKRRLVELIGQPPEHIIQIAFAVAENRGHA